MHQRTVKNQNKPVKKPLKSTIDIKNIQLSPLLKRWISPILMVSCWLNLIIFAFLLVSYLFPKSTPKNSSKSHLPSEIQKKTN